MRMLIEFKAVCQTRNRLILLTRICGLGDNNGKRPEVHVFIFFFKGFLY